MVSGNQGLCHPITGLRCTRNTAVLNPIPRCHAHRLLNLWLLQTAWFLGVRLQPHERTGPTIECPVPLIQGILPALHVQRFRQCRLCYLPDLVAAHRLLRPRREINLQQYRTGRSHIHVIEWRILYYQKGANQSFAKSGTASSVSSFCASLGARWCHLLCLLHHDSTG